MIYCRVFIESPVQGYFVSPKIFFVGFSQFQYFFLHKCCGSQVYSWGYFIGLKVFFVGILYVQNFFSWLFCESRFFSCGHYILVGPMFFMVGISQVQFHFFHSHFLDSEIFSCWLHKKKLQKTKIHKYILTSVFYSKQISAIVNSVHIRKVLLY